MLLRTIQILLALVIIALATIGALAILGLIDPAAAQTSAYRIAGVMAVIGGAALLLVGVFAIGGRGGAGKP